MAESTSVIPEDINQSENDSIRIPDITSRWTKDVLNSLHITTLSTTYRLMDIICGVMNITNEMDEAAETLKCCICNEMPDGLRNLDFTCVGDITTDHEFRLTSENGSLFTCWKFKKRHKLNYYQRLLYESLDKMNPRFSSSGETFGRYLIYLSTLCHKGEAITDWMYLQLFKNFLEMFGLFCYTAPALPKKSMRINGVDIQSNADLLILHEENLETIAVCKVERSQEETGREEEMKVNNEEEKRKIEREKERKLREKEVERRRKEKYEQRKKEKINFLQTETKLLHMNREIKISLQRDSTDVDKCLAIMEDLNMLPVNQVMLKKNQEILKTLKMVRKFNGSDQIRKKAEAIYQKFKSFFLKGNGDDGSQIPGKEHVTKNHCHLDNKRENENRENETIRGEANANGTQETLEKVETEGGNISNVLSLQLPYFCNEDDGEDVEDSDNPTENNKNVNDLDKNTTKSAESGSVLEDKVKKEAKESSVSPPSKRRCLSNSTSDSGQLFKCSCDSLIAPTGGESTLDSGQSVYHLTDNLTSQSGGESTIDTDQSVHHLTDNLTSHCDRESMPNSGQSVRQLGDNTIGRQTAANTGRFVQHLSDNLIGQIGGELLLHYKSSSFKGGVFGMIVQKTNVTFTHLRTPSEDEIGEILEGKDICSPVMMVYSKPYNYLKAEDRMELIKPLLLLRSVYLGEKYI